MKQVQYWLAVAVLPLVLVTWISRVWDKSSIDFPDLSTAGELEPSEIKRYFSGQSTTGSRSPVSLSGSGDFFAIGETTPEWFIQEPGKRSALRPDYSMALRNSNYRNNYFMLQAFKEALTGSWQSTVQLVCNGQQCALGTIVDSEGWIVTKASELDLEEGIDCILCDQREFPAELVHTFAELDLALLRISADGLPAIEWDYDIPNQGKWLATTDSQSGIPAAIGVVSAGPLQIPNQRAVLGVELASDESNRIPGAKVRHVLSGSGAYLAGVQKEDVIVALNGKKVGSKEQLLSMLRNAQGGQFLKLAIHRNEETIETRVRLMDLSMEMLDETEMEVNGPISARASGFSRIFMHDTVLLPNQCGGPVVNLDGKAVGINIARAGRVSTYALPADAIRPMIYGAIQEAKLVSAPAVNASGEVEVPLSTAP